MAQYFSLRAQCRVADLWNFFHTAHRKMYTVGHHHSTLCFYGFEYVRCLVENNMAIPQEIKTEPPEGPAIPPAGTRKWSSLRLALGTKCARPWQIRVTSGQSWWVSLHRGEQFHAWPLRGKSLFKSFGEGFFSFFPPQRNEKILLRHEHVKTQQSRGNDDCYMSPHWEKKSTRDQTLWYFQASQQWFQRAFYGSVGIVAWDDICMY